MRKLLIAALLVAPAALPAPAAAEDRVLTIFGNDKCPANTICVRAPEAERFRIPKDLRESNVIDPTRQSFAQRGKSITDAGAATGIGSCTASGQAGWTGCWAQQMRQARAEKEQAAAANEVTLPK